jgi:Flp pilus assembly protein TadB
LAADAKRAALRYVRENGLDKKAAAAAKDAAAAATSAAEVAAQQMRTAGVRLDREHDLSPRLARLRRRADEAIADADSSWGVRRRARALADGSRRRWPALRAKAAAFFATPLGQACAVGGLVVLIASGALWSLLSLAWALWWLAIPANLFLAERRRREARRQAQAQSDRAEADARRAAAGPFWGAFGGGGGGGPFGGQQQQRAGAAAGASGGGDRGPVIDAEYTTLWDEAGNEGAGGKKGQ